MLEGSVNSTDITDGLRRELDEFDAHIAQYFDRGGQFVSSLLDNGVFGSVAAAAAAVGLLSQAPGHGSVDAVTWIKTTPAHLVPGANHNS